MISFPPPPKKYSWSKQPINEIIGSPTLADAKAIRKTKYLLIWILFADQKLLLEKGWYSNKSQIILLTDNLSTTYINVS